MMKLPGLLSAVGLAAMLSLSGATGVSAAPIGGMQKAVGGSTGDVQTVHYRGHSHCHWRNGRRWCHGGDNYRRYDRYGYRPGIYLRFGYGGDRYGHRRHWRR